MNLDDCIDRAREIVRDAVEGYRPSCGWVLFSGGDDSLIMTHLLMEVCDLEFEGVFHADTETGLSDNYEFIRNVCRRFGWDLTMYQASDNPPEPWHDEPPRRYRDLVLPPEVVTGEVDPLEVEKGGFPVPGMHPKFRSRLKERSVERLVRDCKREVVIEDPSRYPDEEHDDPDRLDEWEHFERGESGVRHERYDRILLASGIRKQESDNRMALSDPVDKRGAQLWVNPIFHWTREDLERYRDRFELDENPVSERVCTNKDCLCMSFANPGELAELEAFYPDDVEWLLDFRDEVKEYFPWEPDDNRPPQWWLDARKGQGSLFGPDEDEIPEGVDAEGVSQLCMSCQSNHLRNRDLTAEEAVEEAEGMVESGDPD